jgi:anti-sigma factor RsiW
MTDAEDRSLLRALLGPAGTEISCEECFDLLDRYVDVELADGPAAADATIPGMRAHLEGCPACHEDHLSLRALAAEH